MLALHWYPTHTGTKTHRHKHTHTHTHTHACTTTHTKIRSQGIDQWEFENVEQMEAKDCGVTFHQNWTHKQLLLCVAFFNHGWWKQLKAVEQWKHLVAKEKDRGFLGCQVVLLWGQLGHKQLFFNFIPRPSHCPVCDCSTNFETGSDQKLDGGEGLGLRRFFFPWFHWSDHMQV